MLDKDPEDKYFRTAELTLIFLSVMFPLLMDLPYRVNIFLSWEGAYRMYLGQIPYKDFGMPLGYGFFIIPFLFFKIFGPYLYTLVIAQVFINLVSLLSFSNMLRILGLNTAQRLLSVLVFCLSYSFFNFWPWYNHSVFVFQMVAFNFILIAIFSEKRNASYLYLALSAFFVFLAFLTKQDSGGIAIVSAGIVLTYDAWAKKRWDHLVCFFLLLSIIGAFMIVPFLKYDFGYWFNYGQPPHNSRLRLIDFFNRILGGSNWEKFYLALLGIILVKKTENFKAFINDRKEVVFFLVTAGVVCQALMIKVTSPLPTDHYSYYHGFAFAYFIYQLGAWASWKKVKYAVSGVALVFLWWSALYWDYASRIFNIPSSEMPLVVPKKATLTPWNLSKYRSFAHIKMPQSTIDGIARIKEMGAVKNKKNLKVLNMSEITPLAYELQYIPDTGQPLWYHLNIGMFQKQVDEFCAKIRDKHYDLVLFQDIPMLPTFNPQEVRSCLESNYKLVDTFEAPRKRTEGDSYIFVYVRK